MSFTPVDHTEKNIQEKSDEMWNYKYLVHKQNFVVMSIVEKNGDNPNGCLPGGKNEADSAWLCTYTRS